MAHRRAVPPNWYELPDAALLDLRLADLPLSLEGTMMEGRVAQLRAELAARGLGFPAALLAVRRVVHARRRTPAMAIPFYLAHPRLERLEQAQMLEVEGGDHEWCMRILRHEAGHAIDNAYRLRRRRQRRALFGRSSQPYPEYYTPKPYSKSFVHAPRRLVRAEPSRRGLRRDLRGVADAGSDWRSATRAGRR